MPYISGDKIGEYIHSKYENYQSFGLARNFGTSHTAASQRGNLTTFVNEARARAKGTIMKESNQNFIHDLEKQMAYIMNPGKTSGVGNYNELREIIVSHMQQFASSLNIDDIDWETLTLKNSAIEKLQKVSSKELEEALGDKSLSTNTLRTSRLGKGDAMYIRSFWKQVQNLNAAIKVLSKKNGQQPSLTSLSVSLSDISKKAVQLGLNKKSGSITMGDDQKSLIQDLRALAKQIIKNAAVSSFEGELAEAVVHQASLSLAGVADKGCEKIISNLIGSNRQGKNIIPDAKFAKGLSGKEILGKGYQKGALADGSIVWETSGNPQGKVDVAITINDDEINANIKNYRMDSTRPYDIKLVSGTNMLYLFQNQTRFLNHYLNQTASTTPLGITMQANQVMRQMLLLSAFTGGGARSNILTNKSANVFIINDKSTGNIKIVPIYSIFDTIIRSNKQLNGVNINLPKYHQWNNEYVRATEYSISATRVAVNQRITTLLQAVRQYKIDVSIGNSYIKSILS